jgi:hypothetical protein
MATKNTKNHEEKNPGTGADRVRPEVLIALKMIYPGSLQGAQLRHVLWATFPQLDWESIKRRIAGLVESGHVQRIVGSEETDARLTPWRERWFRLTGAGVTAADGCLEGRALAV